MTERLRNALDTYREKTKRTASPESVTAVLDRLGLADRYRTVDGPLGPVFVAWNSHGVSAVRQAGDEADFEQWFRRRFNRRALPATDEPEIVDAVRRSLAGEENVAIAFDLRDCTQFEAAVLRKAAEIGRGHARPYAWIAREIDRPRAVRAVGSALANNPIPLLIPCHRVVRSDYSTGEYIFGPEHKRELLEAEGLDLAAIGDLARHGVKFLGQTEDGYFCLPTCGNIAGQPGFVHMHSADEALGLGLEPCDICRPIAA